MDAWQKWRFNTPQTHLWFIKVWFSASTFVVKIATFAKPETVNLSKNSTPSVHYFPAGNLHNPDGEGTFNVCNI